MNVFSNPICNPKMNEPIEVDSKQNEVEVGDVFFTTSSETPKEVGMTSVLIEKQGKMYLNSFCFGYRLYEKYDSYYLAYMLRSNSFREKIIMLAQGISRYNISKNKVMEIDVFVPSYKEQMEIGKYFRDLDTLITLHQCEPKNKMEDNKMLDNINNQILFCDYYEKWIKVYKEGAIRKVTLEKYYMTHRWLKKLIPELKICEMTRINYQQLLNDYALYHERQTTMDFHHQLKGAILDAVDEGLLDRDPTRKAIIKGKTPATKKD